MWCNPTPCETGTPPVPVACPTTGPPDTWITGSANDNEGRGAWYSFTTGATATTYTITTRVDYTTFDNYLNLFGACPPNQTVYDSYQLFGVDDTSPSNGGWPNVGTTITASTDSTAQGCAASSNNYCASMSVVGLAPNTVYYILANSYTDPGLTNGVPTVGYSNQLTFGIAVLTGTSINALQVNVGPNPCCHATTPYGSPGGTCTALPPAPSPSPVSSTTTGTPAPSPAAGSLLAVF